MTLNTFWYRKAQARFKIETTHWIIIELRHARGHSGHVLERAMPACELSQLYLATNTHASIRFLGWTMTKFNCPSCRKLALAGPHIYSGVEELCL